MERVKNLGTPYCRSVLCMLSRKAECTGAGVSARQSRLDVTRRRGDGGYLRVSHPGRLARLVSTLARGILSPGCLSCVSDQSEWVNERAGGAFAC